MFHSACSPIATDGMRFAKQQPWNVDGKEIIDYVRIAWITYAGSCSANVDGS